MRRLAGLVEIQRVHIDAITDGRPRTAGVEHTDHAGKSAGKLRQPALDGPLRSGAGLFPGQGVGIGYAHAGLVSDNVAPQGDLIAQPVELLGHHRGGTKLDPAGFGVPVEIAPPGGQLRGQGLEMGFKRPGKGL